MREREREGERERERGGSSLRGYEVHVCLCFRMREGGRVTKVHADIQCMCLCLKCNKTNYACLSFRMREREREGDVYADMKYTWICCLYQGER